MFYLRAIFRLLVLTTFIIFLLSVLDADTKVVDHTRGWCLSMNVGYHRFGPQLQTDIELDEKDDKTLVELLWYTMAYMHLHKEDVTALKAILTE